MVLDLLGQKKPASVSDLIARKKYPEAMALIHEQLRKAPGDTSLRMQAADVLVLQGKVDDATRTLEAVANDFAKEGFAAKAIAVLKKIQKLDPRRKDLDERIVDLFKATAPTRPVASAPAPVSEFGMLAIDDEEVVDVGFGAAEEPVAATEPEATVNPFISEEPAVEAGQPLQVAAEEQAPPRKKSPLFDKFSEEEMVEVVRGLELLTFEPGDIVVTEGEKGDSLYVLTSGTAKAFVRNKDGGSTQVRQLEEGDFFGEISILTGKPRTATITAAASCEMLRLDRANLDEITQKKPHVREVLQRFYEERTRSAAETEARGIEEGSSETVKLAGLTSAGQTPVPAVEVEVTEADSGEDPKELQAQHLKNCAVDHSRKQNWADAVLAWQQYLGIKPQDTDAMNVLGVLFGKLGRWKEAAETFERFVQINQKDATVYFNLGLCYRQLDLLPQSATAYRKAIALKPDYEKAKQSLQSVLNTIKKEAMT